MSNLSWSDMDVCDEILDRMEPWKKGCGDKEDYYREQIFYAVDNLQIYTYKNWEIFQKLNYDWGDLVGGEISSIENLASAMIDKLLYEEGGYEYIIEKLEEQEDSDDEDEEEDDEEEDDEDDE